MPRTHTRMESIPEGEPVHFSGIELNGRIREDGDLPPASSATAVEGGGKRRDSFEMVTFNMLHYLHHHKHYSIQYYSI